MCRTLSPISTLPVELLAEISLFTIQDETHIADALRVSQICARWRRIAHSTPQLWNRPLVVDVWSKGPVLDSLYASGLRDWLARSAPLTVPFVFNFEEEDMILGSHPVHPSLPFWKELLSVAPRWRSLETTLSGWLPWNFYLFGQLAGLSLSNLEDLSLSVNDRAGALEPFPATPRLRKLSLQVDDKDVCSNLHLPWTQLHEIDLTTEWPDSALHILSQCQNLVRASFDMIPTSDDTPLRWTQEIVALKHLRILSLVFDPFEDSGSLYCMPLLDYVSAPELEEFFMGFEEDFRMDGVASLSAFIAHARSVTHFEVGCLAVGDVDNLIAALTYKDGAQVLLPCLHHLVLQDPELDSDMSEILANMISSRWWKDAELVAPGHAPIPPPVARWTYLELGDNIMEVVGAEMRVVQSDDRFGGLFECLKL
ncbi:F-box domain-containing protein [Favolaschia claudopus]|uniref:F-box domain-containing protein n=1 Tax=Favolaschia claudopus TaxID=2862362 RepID=A0AAW0A268_9AGAR